MGNTPYYNLGYIEPSQDLSQNLDLDELRFRAIDTQLYALYRTFKNGIIENDSNNNISWQIQTYADDNKFLKVSVTSGKGHVSYKAAETTASRDITLPILPTDLTEVKVWFYAVENSNTPITKDVDFIASLIRIDDTDNYINVGGVTINVNNNTITVFNDERQVISLFDSLSALIKNHKHIGGTANPAPIDLRNHVRNTLAGENISNIDLSKVTQGKLDAARLRTVSHNDLSDKGTLSHSQIDSLLNQYLQSDITYKLSDLAIANRLQTLIALKKQSGMSYIDSTQLNTIVYVPGVWPNTVSNTSTGTTANFSDRSFPSSLIGATILDSGPWNSGLGISGSRSDSVFTDYRTYTTKRDFNTAKTYNQNNSLGYYENIKIFGSTDDNSDGYFTINTPLNFKALEQPVTNIFNDNSGWNRAVTTTSNYSSNSVSVDTRLYSYKLFDQAISMNQLSHIGIGFSVGLGTTLSQIGQIYMYLVLGSGTDDPQFANDVKVTFDANQYYPVDSPSTLYLSSADGSEIGYKIFDDVTDSASIGSSIYKIVDLNNFWPSEFRTSIKGLGFYFSTLKGWNPEKSINFYLNTPTSEQVNPSPYAYDELQAARTSTVSNSTSSIFSWNESLYSSTGKFLIRFDSGLENTTYNLIQWDADQPTNTQYTITTRTDIANTLFSDLTNIDTVSDLSSGNLDTNSGSGRYLDVLVTLNSDTSRVYAPKLNSLRISYSTVGSGSTKVYDTTYSNFSTSQSGWQTEAYYSKNIGFGATYSENSKDKNKLTIASTNGIGNWIYLRNNSVIQTDVDNNDTTYEDGVDVANMPTYKTPVQVFSKSSSLGFNTPKDFQQLTDGSSIYCDTLNDRVVKFDLDGNITRLIQGNIRLKRTTRDFVALAGYFNPDTRKLYIAFSQNISTETPFDVTKIYINYDNNLIRLDDSRIDQNETGLFDLVTGNSATIEVTFADTTTGRALVSSISNARTKKIRIDKGAVTNGGSLENTVGIGTESIASSSLKTTNAVSYFNSINSTTYSGTLTTSFGLPVTTKTSSENVDFNNDGVVPTENTLGPSDQIDDVVIDIYEGPIYFKNIYNPISVHYSNNKIIIAQPFENSILAFSDNTSLTPLYSIPSTIVEFIDTKVGSVYELSDDLLLIGSPGTVNTNFNGKMIKYRVSGGLVENKLTFTKLDVVKALPGQNQDEYYVLLDDYLNSGVDTRLKLINSSGNVLSSWGENYEIIHPKGMKILSNNNLVVSE